MSILFTIFFVVGLIMLTAIMLAGLILLVAGFYSWLDLPKDLYAPVQQRIFGIRPVLVFAAVVILWYLSDFAGKLNFSGAAVGLNTIAFILMSIILVSSLRWAWSLLKKRPTLDPRLNRFVNYSFWGSLSGVILVVLSLLSGLLKQ